MADHEDDIFGHHDGAQPVQAHVRVLRVGLHLRDQGRVDDLTAVELVAPPGDVGRVRGDGSSAEGE